MKKMNLKFFGLGAKMVLPLFLLIGLFLVSSNTASAQYVPRDDAIGILKEHIVQLPSTAPALSQRSQEMATVESTRRNEDYFRKTFGEILLYKIHQDQMKVSEAINFVVDVSEAKQIDENAIELIKQEYVNLLSD